EHWASTCSKGRLWIRTPATSRTAKRRAAKPAGSLFRVGWPAFAFFGLGSTCEPRVATGQRRWFRVAWRRLYPQGPRWPSEERLLQGPDGGCPLEDELRADTPISAASFSSSAMRFSVLGWVENRLSMPSPVSGLIMKRCAVAGAASAGSLRISCA